MWWKGCDRSMGAVILSFGEARIEIVPGPPVDWWRAAAIGGVLAMGVLFGVFVYFAARRR